MTNILIKATSCSFRYPGAKVLTIDAQNCALFEARTYRILGASGSGKTTLALLIAGLLKPTSGLLERSELLQKNLGSVRMIFQDPYTALNPRWTIKKSLEDTRPAEGWRDRLPELLNSLALDEGHLNTKPTLLSGGECQRAILLVALLCKPKVLILDEATSMMGLAHEFRALQLIEQNQSQSGTTIVWIAHAHKTVASAHCEAERVSITEITDKALVIG